MTEEINDCPEGFAEKWAVLEPFILGLSPQGRRDLLEILQNYVNDEETGNKPLRFFLFGEKSTTNEPKS